MKSKTDYDKLVKTSREATILSGIMHILEWDHETYMPPGAATIRGEQLKTLAGIVHKQNTSKKFSNLLSKMIDIPSGAIVGKDLSDSQQAAVKEWRRDYIKAKALPNKFVEESAKLSSQSILAWREAKKTNSYKILAPFLKKTIDMARKKAQYLGYQEHPYDALLDQFEPNMTVKSVLEVFTPLRQFVQNLLSKISSKKQIDDSFLYGSFDQEKQIEFSKFVLSDLKYNSDHGRLDQSAHPFSSCSHPTDSRITTKLHSTSLMTCISAVLHEVGHAFYDMGLPQEHYGSPLGASISLGIHESQSRWWETRIGQSKAFWNYYLPILNKYFNGIFNGISLDNFYRAINKVEPSLIRIESDEVTYSLHVILRFELEKALIEGHLNVKEIPEAWNAKMQELLGVTPKSDAEGCLQDIHWSMGAFGYFPTYALGNLYAGHFFSAFEKAYPQWEASVSQGHLDFIKEWLKTSIHIHGRRFSSQELLQKVTGQKFSSEAYMKYLEKKYGEIYGF